MLGKLCAHPRFPYLTGGNVSSGEPSWYGAALAWGRRMQSTCSSFSYPSNVVYLGIYSVEGCFSLIRSVLGFSQWCFVHESLLVFLLVMGSKVKKDLYCYRGDINSIIFIIS